MDVRLRLAAFLLTLTLGLLAAPLPGEGQQAGKVYQVGLLTPGFSRFRTPGSAGFRSRPTYIQWLAEFGYVEGQNIRFEERVAVSDERIAELAAELVRLRVDVIVAEGMPAIRAATQATKTIPIVMLADGDPVRAGLVASLARPGGNVTGASILAPELNGKRLGLLKQAVPGLRRVAVLWNPAYSDRAQDWQAMQAAARVLGVMLQSLEVHRGDDFEPAFDAAITERAGALLVLGDPLTFGLAARITKLARSSQLPAMYPHTRFARPGHDGLMSYGPDDVVLARRVAALVDKILKGAKPADLPVERPTRFTFNINLKTAKALGLTIPESVLIWADRIIE